MSRALWNVITSKRKKTGKVAVAKGGPNQTALAALEVGVATLAAKRPKLIIGHGDSGPRNTGMKFKIAQYAFHKGTNNNVLST